MFWLYVFWVLGSVLLLQSVWSLLDGYKFLSYLRRSQATPLSAYHPNAALIVPCKGLDVGLEENLGAYLSQDYSAYQVIFAVSSESDPAFPVLRGIVRNHDGPRQCPPQKISIVVAGISETNGEKVHNLLAALQRVDSGTEVLAFADSDARPSRGWLRALIAPLGDPAVTVSTGFRWHLPSASFASRLQAAWDSAIATMFGDHARNIAWGGSMALRQEDFRRMRIAEKYWQGTVSDDYAIAQAAHDVKGTIRFEPRCLVPTEPDTRIARVLKWTNRQIILTRVYAPKLWLQGMASFGLYVLAMLVGVAVLVLPAFAPTAKAQAGLLLAVILCLGMAKGRLRLIAARQSFPQHRERLKRWGDCYWQLTILTPWLMFWNFCVAAFVCRIEWRGTVYHLKSRKQVCILRRSAP
ncbi:MAG TPA: glycosyltransferase [Terriglobia bacterium]|nr:glycosyltransferase [Terriglobia bacterium]